MSDRSRSKRVELELDPLEEGGVGVVGVLLQVDDVAAVVRHERGDRGHDPGPIRTGHEEDAGRRHEASRASARRAPGRASRRGSRGARPRRAPTTLPGGVVEEHRGGRFHTAEQLERVVEDRRVGLAHPHLGAVDHHIEQLVHRHDGPPGRRPLAHVVRDEAEAVTRRAVTGRGRPPRCGRSCSPSMACSGLKSTSTPISCRVVSPR